MSCCGSGRNPTSPEYTRRYKPENNAGCGCRGINSCDTPSLAEEGSALYEWEQIYGKLVTTISFQQDAYGRKVQVVTKTPCPKSNSESSTHGCCALRYKVIR